MVLQSVRSASGQILLFRFAPMVVGPPTGVGSLQRTLLWQAAWAAVGGFATVRIWDTNIEITDIRLSAGMG